MTRRRFTLQLSTAVASLLLLPGMFCNKASDLISSLRSILTALEHALSLLGALQGLLPDAVNTTAAYLIKVTHFVNATGQILENTTITAADKVSQILTLAGDLVLPVIPPPIGPILTAVVGAVNHFLSYFSTDVDHAAAAARSRTPGDIPKGIDNLSPAEVAELRAIEADAQKDTAAVMDWQKKALITPHTQGMMEYMLQQGPLV